MASKKFEKCSEEWQFFTEFWQFRQEYYEADDDEEWCTEMIRAGEEIIKKYKNTEFAKFAQNLVFNHFDDVEMRWKKQNE